LLAIFQQASNTGPHQRMVVDEEYIYHGWEPGCQALCSRH
jgi:hypothetical protein